jgi:hypothetical protein
MTALWNFDPCNLVEIDRRIRGAVVLKMEVVSTTETSVNFHQTTRGNIVEELSSAAVRT